MRYKKHLIAVSALVVLFNACGRTGFSSAMNSSSSSSSSSTVGAGANIMAVTVGCGYFNEPCVSVTICQPGTNNCQTIPNVLLDTGSYGLRLFSSVIGITLNNDTNTSGQTYAECISYADGSSQWGPVRYADVELASERASNIPIQVIDSTYASSPSDCTDLDTSPAYAGFNGILGVGLFAEDCGDDCTTIANNRLYFACSGTNCSSTTIPLAKQVVNPVARLSGDNNGVVLTMSSIPTAGATSASGTLTIGIGTQADNAATATQTLTADQYGEFMSNFNGKTYSEAFIDSGSNGLYFPYVLSSQSPCSGDYSGFYCPSSTLSFSAVQIGQNGKTASVSFSVNNAISLLNSAYTVSPSLGGEYDGGFDWGLPFFFGRKVFVGLEGRSSSLGTGPYWAF